MSLAAFAVVSLVKHECSIASYDDLLVVRKGF